MSVSHSEFECNFETFLFQDVAHPSKDAWYLQHHVQLMWIGLIFPP